MRRGVGRYEKEKNEWMKKWVEIVGEAFGSLLMAWSLSCKISGAGRRVMRRREG